ncbi:MAG: Gfo/Idh/MocA family oxidoreductase [Planctomycetes bacterium]|nr:Gfo/Idh/MocA family oxidoreductase [Planctomycetota bacterium]
MNLHYHPVLPQNRGLAIALCGAGGIVNDAHLPAYRKAGFKIAGIYDRRREAAERTAARFEIPRVYESLEQLAADSHADLIDVAVPATENLGIVESVAAAGKPMLLQKPLAEDLDTARRTIEVLDRHRVIAAVNQQMRWEPGVRATRDLLDQGHLGDLFNIAVLVFVDTPWHLWGWLMKKPTIDVLYHSIHYLDSIRFLTGQEPQSIFCDGATRPGYDTPGETRLTLHLRFAGELRATILTNHHAAYGLEGQQAEFRVEGTEGAAIRKMGLLMNYPCGVADAFRFTFRNLTPSGIGPPRDPTMGAPASVRPTPATSMMPLRSGPTDSAMPAWVNLQFPETWFPDAFVGPMSSLMRAVSGEIERPETDVHDNLNTLRLVFAAYESIRARQVVSLP